MRIVKMDVTDSNYGTPRSCGHRASTYLEIGRDVKLCLPCAQQAGAAVEASMPLQRVDTGSTSQGYGLCPFCGGDHLYSEHSKAGMSASARRELARLRVDEALLACDAALNSAARADKLRQGLEHIELGRGEICTACVLGDLAKYARMAVQALMDSKEFLDVPPQAPHLSETGSAPPGWEELRNFVGEMRRLLLDSNRPHADIVRETAVRVLAAAYGVSDENAILHCSDVLHHANNTGFAHEAVVRSVASYLTAADRSAPRSMPSANDLMARAHDLVMRDAGAKR